MPDREKLIGFLDDIQQSGVSYEEYERYGMRFQDTVSNEEVASHLISHGVTVRERGRWEDEHGGKYANPRYRCPVCKGRALYKFEQDLLGSWKGVQALTDFCPNCGADMR